MFSPPKPKLKVVPTEVVYKCQKYSPYLKSGAVRSWKPLHHSTENILKRWCVDALLWANMCPEKTEKRENAILGGMLRIVAFSFKMSNTRKQLENVKKELLKSIRSYFYRACLIGDKFSEPSFVQCLWEMIFFADKWNVRLCVLDTKFGRKRFRITLVNKPNSLDNPGIKQQHSWF